MELTAHITATKDFLHNLVGNECYADVLASQAVALSDTLENTVLPVEFASGVVKALQSCGFDAKTTTDLVNKAGQAVSRSSATRNKTMVQDYRSLLSYFTTKEWDEIQKTEMKNDARLRLIAGRGGQLGLMHPSERTVQFITAASIALSRGFVAGLSMTPEDNFTQYKHAKDMLKTCQGSFMGPVKLLEPGRTDQ